MSRFFLGDFEGLTNGDLVILLDVSTSMSIPIKTLQQYLSDIGDALSANEITRLHLVKFSDWELCHKRMTPMTFIASGSLQDIIQVLKGTSAGEMGSGGSVDEAHCTALNMVLRAISTGNAQSNAGVNVIIISDAQPHSPKTHCPDATLERAQMKAIGMPTTYGEALDLASRLGVNVCAIGIKKEFAVTQGDIFINIDNCRALAPALSIIISHFLGIETITTGLPDMTIYDANRVRKKTMRSITVSPDGREAYFRRIMNIFQTKPHLLPSVMGISVAFFTCLRNLPMTYRDEWSKFIKDFRTANPHLEKYVEGFTKQRVNNTDEIYQQLSEDTTYAVLHAGRAFKSSAILPNDLYATFFGHAMTHDSETLLLNTLSGLSIVTGRWFPKLFKEENLTDLPDYFPITDRPINMITFCSFLTGFKTVPHTNTCFRFALWLTEHASKILDPEIRDVLYRSAIEYIQSNIDATLPWLMDPNYRQAAGMEYIPPWYNLGALGLLLAGCTVSGQPDTVINRVRRLISLREYTSHGNDQLDIITLSDPIVDKHQVRLVKCPGGYWMPETLCHDGKCIYCMNMHAATETTGAISYHLDGTEHPTPDRFDPDGTAIRNKRERCGTCKCYYSIVDMRLGGNSRRCFNCRTGLERGIQSPVVSCISCNEKWVMNCDRSNWTCSSCQYPVRIQTPITTKKKIHNLAMCYPRVQEALQRVYPMLPSILFQSPHKNKTSEVMVPEIVHYVEPVPQEPQAPQEPENIGEILDHINLLGQKPECCIGRCVGRHQIGRIISPCGKCSMMACMACLSQMLIFKKGSTVPRSAILCFCRQPFSDTTLDRLGLSDAQIPKLLSDSSDDSCVHVCLNDGDRKLCTRYVLGRTIADCAEAQEAMQEGTQDTEASGNSYRCPPCLQFYLQSQPSMAPVSTEQEVLNSLPAGTLLRLCPGTCGDYQSRTDDRSCAHMHCRNCNIHWCWICRSSYGSSSDCYDHMSTMYEHAENAENAENSHLHVWGIGPNDNVCPHESDRIANPSTSTTNHQTP